MVRSSLPSAARVTAQGHDRAPGSGWTGHRIGFDGRSPTSVPLEAQLTRQSRRALKARTPRCADVQATHDLHLFAERLADETLFSSCTRGAGAGSVSRDPSEVVLRPVQRSRLPYATARSISVALLRQVGFEDVTTVCAVRSQFIRPVSVLQSASFPSMAVRSS